MSAAGNAAWSSRVVRTRIRVVLARPPRVVAVMVKVISWARVSGSCSACGSLVSFLRRVRMLSDSCSMTSSDRQAGF